MRKSVLVLLLIMLGSLTFTANAGSAESEGSKQDTEEAISYIPARYEAMVRSASEEFGVPAHILASFMAVESEGDHSAESATGAIGLMQITTTAFADVRRVYDDTYFSDDLWDPRNNIRVAAAYISILRDVYGFERLEEIAVAYNEGPRAAKRLNAQAINTHFYTKRVQKVLSANL